MHASLLLNQDNKERQPGHLDGYATTEKGWLGMEVVKTVPETTWTDGDSRSGQQEGTSGRWPLYPSGRAFLEGP